MSIRLACLAVALSVASAAAQEEEEAPPERGLLVAEPGTSPGYTLIAPFSLETTYLLDDQARVVHSWESRYPPGLAPYLLPNGNLLRGIQVEDLPVDFGAGGITGGLQEFTWDGELVWQYILASDEAHLHHDVEPLPNGNLLAIAWTSRTQEEALAAGRRETHAGEDGMWPAAIFEIEPLRPHGARIVWEWHVWDHLVQDTDPDLPNYGAPSAHPHRVDINGDIPREAGESSGALSDDERAQLIALGYIDDTSDTGGDDDGDDGDEEDDKRADWLHLNGIDYNAELDQIVVSSWWFNEIWVIDHGITTEEARGSKGDLLFRWGNPQTYGRGSAVDRRLFHQHDPQWIPAGFPGAGDITIFNNGRSRPDEEYSSVVQITPPLQPDGTYAIEGLDPFGPEAPTWEWTPPEDDRLYSSFISGTHRLANGNTLVIGGPQGRVLEVTPDSELVWDLHNPWGELDDDGEPGRFTYAMFRATRIPPDHPGLRGRELSPVDPQPLDAVAEFAARPAAGAKASEWRDLMTRDDWTLVNSDSSTFRPDADPDDEDEQILICSGVPTGLMRTTRMYENFILDFEWRHMEEGGNAGLFVWADPMPALGGPFARGIEVQICNLGNGSWYTSHGDIFPIWGAVMTPDPRFRISGSRSMPNEDSYHQNPTGEWNHYRVTAVDGSITLEVNGHLVTAGTGCSPSKGFLHLESEGGEVHFRNMKIWELPAGTHAAGDDRTANAATDHEAIYGGVDLDGWDVLSGDWAANDWRLTSRDVGELKKGLPSDWTHVVFDVKEPARDAGDTRILPFRIGDEDLWDDGVAGEWTRVELDVEGDEVRVLVSGEVVETVPKSNDLVLVNPEGGEIAYANLFVSTTD